MLVIVNPYASTVTGRLKRLVLNALRGRYDVEAIDTAAPGHAIQICHEAAEEGFDVVVAFGGDGTVNEVANGLVGSDVPLTCLPGGATNVFCRTLGIPADLVDAAEHLLHVADVFQPRKVDVGFANQRAFVFAAGVGLDASVVKRVDSHPKVKARIGEYFFTGAALVTYAAEYVVKPPRMRVEVAGRTIDAVTTVVQNSDPYTYFASSPIRLVEGVSLTDGRLGATVLRKSGLAQMPTLMPRVFSTREGSLGRHSQIDTFTGLETLRVSTLDDRELPLQADGDYMGSFTEIEFSVKPLGLSVVA
jgi:diacylglycerol kinase family enzyme